MKYKCTAPDNELQSTECRFSSYYSGDMLAPPHLHCEFFLLPGYHYHPGPQLLTINKKAQHRMFCDTKTLFLPNIFSACSEFNKALSTVHWPGRPAPLKCANSCFHSQHFTVLPYILLTNYRKILVYVLCQVSIHYLPMKDILKQFRHLSTQKCDNAFLCSFIYKFW